MLAREVMRASDSTTEKRVCSHQHTAANLKFNDSGPGQTKIQFPDGMVRLLADRQLHRWRHDWATQQRCCRLYYEASRTAKLG